MAPASVKKWESIGQTKICVKVQTEKEMYVDVRVIATVAVTVAVTVTGSI